MIFIQDTSFPEICILEPLSLPSETFTIQITPYTGRVPMNCLQGKISSVAFLACIFLLFAHCSSPSSHQAGGETLNERTVTVYMPTPNGAKKAAKASVSIGVAGEHEQAFTYFTNDSGQFRVPELKGNLYALFIEKVDLSDRDSCFYAAFQNKVFISPDSHSVKDDTLDPTGELKGVVELEEYHHDKLGRVDVHILGTSKYTDVDEEGAFSFKRIASGAVYDLKIIPNIEGYTNKYVNDIEFGEGLSVYDMGRIKLSLDGIPPVKIKSLEYDSLRGVVSVVWEPLTNHNINQYYIYRSKLRAADEKPPKVQVGYTPDTVFYDTVYSMHENNDRFDYYDINRYTCFYMVEAQNNLEERSIPYNPQDTIWVSSPRRFVSGFEQQLLDSASGRSISEGTANRTTAIAFAVKNDRWPVSGIKITDDADSVVYYRMFDSAVVEFSDTLYDFAEQSCEKKLVFRALDSAGNCRPYCTDVLLYNVADFNLEIVSLQLPMQMVAGKKMSGAIKIGRFGTADLNGKTVNIGLYAGSKPLWLDSLNQEDFQIRKVLTVEINESNSDTIPSGDRCSLKVIINEFETIFESDRKDNVLDTIVNVTNVDLEVKQVFFDSTWLFDSRLYSCGALIKNCGTTDYIPDWGKVKVDFQIDDKDLSWGYIDSLDAGDSAFVWGTISKDDGNFRWPAQKGKRYLKAVITDLPSIIESDTSNNSYEQNFIVDDYNIGVDTFWVAFNDTLNRVTCTTVISKSGELSAEDHPNESFDEMIVMIQSDSASMSYPVSMAEIGRLYTCQFEFDKDIDKLFGNGSDSIHFSVHIDTDDRLMETTDDDNNSDFWVPKEVFYVNGRMDSIRQDIDSLPYGWEMEENENGDCEWQLPGFSIATSPPAVSIRAGGGKTFSCWKYPVTVQEDKFYRVGAKLDGTPIEQDESSGRPAVWIGFYGSWEYAGASVPKGRFFSNLKFSGVLQAPPGSIYTDTRRSHYLTLNLGFPGSSGDESAWASGEVIFDDVFLETIPQNYLAKE